jgi:integrase
VGQPPREVNPDRHFLVDQFASRQRVQLVDRIVGLRLTDIDSKRDLILVRDRKGAKDRNVMLSTQFLAILPVCLLTCSLWPRPKAAFGPGFRIGGRKHISRAAASHRVRVAMAADFEPADLVAVNFVGPVG